MTCSGAANKQDMREITIDEFMRRYHVDVGQATRVSNVAQTQLRAAPYADANPDAPNLLADIWNGLRSYTKLACRFRIAATSATPDTSSKTPTCPASHAPTRQASRYSCARNVVH